MGVKAIIFDLDGTLVSFNLDYRTVRAEVRGYLLRVGVPASQLSANESIFEMLKKAELFLKNSGKTAETVEAIRSEVWAIAEKYELEAAKSTSLLPGAGETLKALKRMGLKIGFLSLNTEETANKNFHRLHSA